MQKQRSKFSGLVQFRSFNSFTFSEKCFFTDCKWITICRILSWCWGFFCYIFEIPFWTKYFHKINIVLLKYIFGANSKWHNFLLFTKFLWKVILTKVKSNLKSSITSFVYELPHELLQDLGIVILRNKEKKREISRMVEVTG